jgi:hypothetical protein
MKTKKIIGLLTFILMACFTGVLFASVIGVAPAYVVGTIIGLGAIPLPFAAGTLMFNWANMVWADGEKNMGGLKTIGYFIPVADCDTIPVLPAVPATPAEEVTLDGDITPASGKYFHKLYSTLETSEVIDENQGEPDAQSFVHKANIFYPGTKVEALAFAANVNNSNMLFIFEESTGNKRVIGSEAFPAKCKPSFTTGTATKDRKGMTMEIYSYGYTPAPLYTGVIALEDGNIS